MATASKGDKVRVHYRGTLDDGTVFDDTHEREPIEFVLGQGKVIPGFEEAVIDMEPGDEKTVDLSTDQAYGERRDELVQDIPDEELADDFDPDVGEHIEIHQEQGPPIPAQVVDSSDEGLTVDANHPLAGKNLTFEIELLDILEEDAGDGQESEIVTP